MTRKKPNALATLSRKLHCPLDDVRQAVAQLVRQAAYTWSYPTTVVIERPGKRRR